MTKNVLILSSWAQQTRKTFSKKACHTLYMKLDYTTSGQKAVLNGCGQTFHQKDSGLIVSFFPVLRNVPLPFWPGSTFPNTIFGIRGVEERRRGGEREREREWLWPIMSVVIKQNSPGTKTIHTTLSSTKNGHNWRWATGEITGKASKASNLKTGQDLCGQMHVLAS